jgi:hypothetical protein
MPSTFGVKTNIFVIALSNPVTEKKANHIFIPGSKGL